MHAETAPGSSTYHGGQSVLVPAGTALKLYSWYDARVKLSTSSEPPRTSSALAFNSTCNSPQRRLVRQTMATEWNGIRLFLGSANPELLAKSRRCIWR